MMIPYKVIECCQETNSIYVRMCMCRFIKSLSFTMMIFKKFLNQYISHKKQLNMLKLWDKSEKVINNQRITFTCIGALQTGPYN